MCMCVCMCVSVCKYGWVCVLTCVQIHECASVWKLEVCISIFLNHSPLFCLCCSVWRTGNLTSLSQWARLTGQRAPGSHVSLPNEHVNYRFSLLWSALKWVLGIKLWSLDPLQSETSLQILIFFVNSLGWYPKSSGILGKHLLGAVCWDFT